MLDSVWEWILLFIILLSVFSLIGCIYALNHAKKVIRKDIQFDLETVRRRSHFVFISDLHLNMKLVPWNNIFDIIVDADPEYVLVGGDLSSTLESVPLAHDFMAELAKRVNVPIYLVFGNHDHNLFDEKKVGASFITREGYAASIEKLSNNIRVLHNEIIDLGDVMLAALEDYRTCKVNISELSLKWAQEAEKKNKPLILLTHNPDSVRFMCENAQQMKHVAVISGHTHGGQIRTPFNIEYTLIRHDVLPKEGVAYGMHNYKGINLYISSGLGCSALPMRYKSTAEVVVIDVI
ncbi:MAG: metallophosphoesterase [Clostridia bacterium]|nr:metallophosphoesterase [Clostridia bacterium]